MLGEAEDELKRYQKISGEPEEMMVVCLCMLRRLLIMRLSHKKIHYNKLRELKYQEEKPAEVAENQGAAKAVETKKQPLKIKVLDSTYW